MTLGQPLFMENDTTDQHAIQFRQMLKDIFGEKVGVLGAGDLAVTQRGAGANMSVDVAAGSVVWNGSVVAAQGFYYAFNDATVNVAITASNPSNPRIDSIIVKARDAFYSGTDNDGQILAIAGTPAGSPSPPDLVALGHTNYIILANVTVGAGVTSIVNANIATQAVQAVARGGIQVVNAPTDVLVPAEGDHAWDQVLDRGLKRINGAWEYARPTVFGGANNPANTDDIGFTNNNTYGLVKSLTVNPSRDCLLRIEATSEPAAATGTAGEQFMDYRIQVDNNNHPISGVDNTWNFHWTIWSTTGGLSQTVCLVIDWPIDAGSHTIDVDAKMPVTNAMATMGVRFTRIKCSYVDSY